MLQAVRRILLGADKQSPKCHLRRMSMTYFALLLDNLLGDLLLAVLPHAAEA